MINRERLIETFCKIVSIDSPSSEEKEITEVFRDLLEQLGFARQIICITHLSQIASKGKNHFKVNKLIEGKRTEVYIEKLSKKKRISEIASLISGSKITEMGKQQAEQLLTG